MGFSGVFAIGLSGVNAYATSLEAISNNIANTQTTGYKRARTDFSNLVTAEAAGGGISGGGVDASIRQLVGEQGAITRTSSATDLAVSGDGFFVVADTKESGAPVQFTRSGGFTVQTDGSLMNEAGYFLQAAPISANGEVSVNGLNGLETVNVNRLDRLGEATSTIRLNGNIDANTPLATPVTQNVQMIDADGATRNLALTFSKVANNQWTMQAAFTDGAQESIANGTIVFGADGRVDTNASSFPESIAIAENSDQSIDVNFDLLIQTASANNLTSTSANGAAPAGLTGVEIGTNGRITALFANGLRRDIYQIALANFINQDGLNEGARSTFLTNPSTGNLSLDIPQTGRAGAIESRALEISTVDIGQEFSALIQTQRAYAANTRVISIADELWRTLTQTAA